MIRYAFQMVSPIKDGKMSRMANPINDSKTPGWLKKGLFTGQGL